MNARGLKRVAFPVFLIFSSILVYEWVRGPDAPTRHEAVAAQPSVPFSATANIFVSLAKRVVPSVVNISTTMVVRGGARQPGPEDLFRRFFEDYMQRGPRAPQEGESHRTTSLGTGFIIDAAGLILTNNHVVADADEIKIQFTEEPDERPTDGEVVGRDPELDLALIKVKTKRTLTPLPLGDSDALSVGEYVLAVGNPFGQGHSVTHGIISAKQRRAPDFALANYLQTDAPINPGNSGGPLVNLKGDVIGINNAIDARAQGIGFAIPISLVKQVIPQLKAKGVVSRGYIGVVVNELTQELAAKLGVSSTLVAPFVVHVYPGEPADLAGMKPYDVLLEFNSKPVKYAGDIMAGVTQVPVGENVPIKVLRGGKEIVLDVKVSQRPSADRSKGSEPKRGKKPARIEIGMSLLDGAVEKIKGVIVEEVDYGSVAELAGLEPGDIIEEVDKKVVLTVEEFYAIVKERKQYMLKVRRLEPYDSFSVVILDLRKAP